jgi:hypothetical protein
LWSEYFRVDGIWETLTRYHGLDWVGIVFSMVSTNCLAKKRKRGFLLGMTGNVAFVGFGLLAQSAASVIANAAYLILNARGWWKWKENPPKEE